MSDENRLVLPEDRMSEAEVALRLAFHLLALPDSSQKVLVTIDGAQVLVEGMEVFPIREFLHTERWEQVKQSGKNPWQGVYAKNGAQMDVRSQSGLGDVVCRANGKTYRAECKKGPLGPKKGSPEYRLLREALGQLLTIEEVGSDDVLVVAVPRTSRFSALAAGRRERPLVARTGIKFALVGQDGSVTGLA